LLSAPRPEPKPTKSSNWLLFRGNAEQTGLASSKIPDRLDVLWTFKAGDGFEGAVAVAGGVGYAAPLAGEGCALDLKNGKKKWACSTGKEDPGPFKAPVSVRKGLVYAGDLDGFLHCIDAAKGKKKWIFEAGAELGGVNFYKDGILVGSHDEHLYC